MKTASEKMYSARTALVLDQPFWGSLALSLKLQADLTCKTAWTDGRTLGYNPTFIDTLNHERIVGLIAHEVEHCALGHPWRRDDRDGKRWNGACDKAINHDLREAGFSLPDGVHFAEGDEIGKSAEWIYARMQQQPQGGGGGQQPQQGQGQGQGQPQASQGQGDPDDQDQDDQDQQPDDEPGDPLGEVRDAPTAPDEEGEPAPTEQDWKQKTIAAAQQASMMGSMPGGAARNVQQAMRPRVDVKSLLLRFFQERTSADYTWSRPNTRYIAHGLYLPALESKDLGEIAIMVDTSGSVDQVALNHARGIVEDVLNECNPAGVTLYFADAAVCNRQRMEKGEPLTWEPAGGGGTDFRPALKAIEEDQVTCAICITDLEGTFPDVPPDFPVIWLATEDHQAPFGETVFTDQ